MADYMLGRTYLYPFMRFATPDVARDGWNLYGYTGGNPVNRVDPDGRYGVIAEANRRAKVVANAVSILLSVGPVSGEVKDAQEALTGVDLVTGEQLTAGERVLTGVAMLAPFVGGKLVRKGMQAAASKGDEVVDATGGVLKARHHTDPGGLSSIRRDGTINPSRGEPAGVHVEVEPFGSVQPGLNGPKAQTGAASEGAFVELNLPSNAVPTNVGPRNTAVIPTSEPLQVPQGSIFRRVWPWTK